MHDLWGWVGGILLGVAVLLAGLLAFGPRPVVDARAGFADAELPANLDAHLAAQEARFADITPGTGRRIVWAGAPGARTDLAVIYLHGFSATSEEIRPVPDLVAQGLGANLHFMRFTGHGRSGAALADATAEMWIADMAEALAIGRRIGDRVIVIATSNGGTLARIAASDPVMADRVAGIAFLSPNFGLKSAAGVLLELPFVRVWGPWIAGAQQGFVPVNAAHARYWTTAYPTHALLPLGALVRHVRGLDPAGARVPALFFLAADDTVIDAGLIGPVAARWGAPARVEVMELGPLDDPARHVIAGDTLSPGQTGRVADMILEWARGL